MILVGLIGIIFYIISCGTCGISCGTFIQNGKKTSENANKHSDSQTAETQYWSEFQRKTPSFQGWGEKCRQRDLNPLPFLKFPFIFNTSQNGVWNFVWNYFERRKNFCWK